MSFSQSAISNPVIVRDGDEALISWASTAPVGTVYQVYIDRGLAWHGFATMVRIPWPTEFAWIDIGTVDAADASTSFGSSLSAGSNERANLTWLGGTYLSLTIARFDIYASSIPGGAISYAAPIDSVIAYDGGIVQDGYGVGRYGQGGYGYAAGSYSWTSKVLANGVWSFAVVPVDAAGNIPGSTVTTTVSIVGPPNPPAINPAGSRLTYSYAGSGTRLATLHWLASPP